MSTNISMKTCGLPSSECGADRLPIGNACYSYEITDVKHPDFMAFGLVSQDPNLPVLESTPNVISPYECVQACANLNGSTVNCAGARYNFSTGECTLLGPEGSPNRGVQTGASTGCVNVYLYQPSSTGLSNKGISIVNGGNTMGDILNINLSSGIPSTSSTTLIEDKNYGQECRSEIASGNYSSSDYPNAFSGMEQFCKDNPNLQVCNEFCANANNSDYCPGPKTILLYVFLSIFLVSLFVFIIVLVKGKKKIAYGIGGVMFVFLVLSIWQIITYFKKKGSAYTGNQPDYPAAGITPTKNCAKMNFSCLDGTAPLGSRCTVDDNGNFYGRNNCEYGCCPAGAQPINGKCYQTPAKGNISWNNNGTLKVTVTCPPNYVPGPGWPVGNGGPPYCYLDNTTVYQGNMYCTNTTGTPVWTECNSTTCTVPPVTSQSFNGQDSGSSPVKFCTWPPPKN